MAIKVLCSPCSNGQAQGRDELHASDLLAGLRRSG
jgi:hypothetical protein